MGKKSCNLPDLAHNTPNFLHSDCKLMPNITSRDSTVYSIPHSQLSTHSKHNSKHKICAQNKNVNK